MSLPVPGPVPGSPFGSPNPPVCTLLGGSPRVVLGCWVAKVPNLGCGARVGTREGVDGSASVLSALAAKTGGASTAGNWSFGSDAVWRIKGLAFVVVWIAGGGAGAAFHGTAGVSQVTSIGNVVLSSPSGYKRRASRRTRTTRISLAYPIPKGPQNRECARSSAPGSKDRNIDDLGNQVHRKSKSCRCRGGHHNRVAEPISVAEAVLRML